MDRREYRFYFVSTPIGNFDEMTYRAVEILKSVDEIWCEDTQHSKVLLNHFEINKPLQSFHKYSDNSKIESCIKKLQEGKKIAYISDAGMPCISDPGARLVDALIKNDIEYTVVSGACACINALILSGLNTDNFFFVGFLKDKNSEREEQKQMYCDVNATLIFYSSMHDINKDLQYLYSVLGDRQCAIMHEMTKMFESVERGTLKTLQVSEPRGEYVICVEGKKPQEDDLCVEEYLQLQLKLSDSKDAIKETAKKFKLQKNEVYQLYLQKYKDK